MEDKLRKREEELQEELLEGSPLGMYIGRYGWILVYCVLRLDVCDGKEEGSVLQLHSTPALSFMKGKVCSVNTSSKLGRTMLTGCFDGL